MNKKSPVPQEYKEPSLFWSIYYNFIDTGNQHMAQQDTDDLTIKKLTYKNPTMKAKFDEARQARENQ